MKRISLVLISISLAVSGFFTSCTDDTDTGFDAPTVEVKYTAAGGSAVDITDGDTIIKSEGTPLSFDVKFTMGDAGDKLTNVTITSEISNKTYNIVDSALNEGIFDTGDKTFTYNYKTSIGSAVEKITFTVMDKKDRPGTAVIYIKPSVVVPVGAVKTTEAIIMGNYGSTYESCYSLSLNKAVSTKGGSSQPSSIDMLYYYTSGDKATLAGPSNATLPSLYSNATYGIATWSVRNNTKLLKTTVSNFDAITDSDLFDTAFPDDLTSATDAVKSLELGNVIAMKTAGDKTALIKVTEINGTGSTSYIKITIKTVL